MPDFDAWLTTDYTEVMSAETRAALAWRRISDRPSTITIKRANATIAAQTVRIESDNSAQDSINSATNRIIATHKVTIFGVRDHATIADTDIKRSDRFNINGAEYQVIALMTPPGEVQAICEAVQAT